MLEAVSCFQLLFQAFLPQNEAKMRDKTKYRYYIGVFWKKLTDFSFSIFFN